MLRPFCKPQTNNKPKPHGNRLVSPFPSISGQKSYFPARFMSVKRTLSNIAVARVSVLDLDNSVRFSRDTHKRLRKQP